MLIDFVLVSPEIFKPGWGQLGVPYGVLNVAVAEVCMQGPRVVPSVSQRIAAGVSEHVRMRFEG
jgi:hypothetical protein